MLAPLPTSAEFLGDWVQPGVRMSLSYGRSEQPSRGRGALLKVTSFLNGCPFPKTPKPRHPKPLGGSQALF